MSTPKNHVRTLGRALRYLARHRDASPHTVAAARFVRSHTDEQLAAFRDARQLVAHGKVRS